MTHHYQIRDSDASTGQHPVDIIEPLPVDDSTERTADAFRMLLAWLLAGHGVNSYASRLLTLALHLDVECEVDNYEQIAQLVGSTRSNVQLQGRQLERAYGLRFNQARKDSTRRANARSATKS
jgi:hypothetical protein